MRQRLAEGRLAQFQQARLGAGRQRVRKLLQEIVERRMDEGAALRQAGIGIERIERAQPQNVPRIDRIGIADPGLDRGDRELARPRR